MRLNGETVGINEKFSNGVELDEKHHSHDDGDVIAKGAFADTLKAWAESGRPVPVLYGHNMDDPDFNIGTAELMEDERGLKVSVVLPRQQPRRDNRRQVPRGRRISVGSALRRSITSKGKGPEHPRHKKGAAMYVSILIWRFILTVHLRFNR